MEPPPDRPCCMGSDGSWQNPLAADRSSGNSCAADSQQQGSWLTSVQLVAVQPACLKAHPDVPQPQAAGQEQPAEQPAQQAVPEQPGQQQQQPQQQQLQQGPHDEQQQELHVLHHDLLLHLEAVVSCQPSQLQGPGAAEPNPPMPLLVSRAVLQFVLLNCHMQVLLHKQCSLIQLLQQQQVSLQPGSSHADAQHDMYSSSSRPSGDTASPRCSLAATTTSSSTSRGQVLHFNVQLSAPCQPSPLILDALHLFVTLCDAQLSDVQQGAGQHSAYLVAELPLLVMPAAAQQEVQQLLLPAMRQDVQAELQQQEQQQGLALTPADLAWQSMQVERAAWQHFNQLALDILLIMQLSAAVRAGSEAADADAAAGPSGHAADAGAGASSSAAAALPQHAGHRRSTAVENLMQAVNMLLLPLLLPFLTAHGLNNLVNVLLQSLPPQLQLHEHWQEQQLERLEALAHLPAAGAGPSVAVAAAVVASSAMLDTPAAAPAPAAAGSGGVPAAADVSGPPSSPKTSTPFTSARSSPAAQWNGGWGEGWDAADHHQQQQGSEAAEATAAGAAAVGGAGSSTSHAEGVDMGMRPAVAVLGAAAGEEGAEAAMAAGGGAPGLVLGSSGAAVQAAAGVPCWMLPITQFHDMNIERRYLAWKHRQLLYLDKLGGVWTLVFAATLLKHSLFLHPTTLVILLMTLIKALPHMPLLLGYKEQHVRFRELWMYFVAPARCLLLLFLLATRSRTMVPAVMPPLPLAYRSFWRMQGELILASLWAFFQHMRLMPFILYTVFDQAVVVHMWAPWVGYGPALIRGVCSGVVSIVLCWALEVCLRRRFVLEGLHFAGNAGPS